MNILLPIPITQEMLIASSIPAVDSAAGEIAWQSGESVVPGNERVFEGNVYECALAPENASLNPVVAGTKFWTRMRPSNRMAPFDLYISTAATAVGHLEYTIPAVFVPDIVMHGINADRVDVTVRAGGNVIDPRSVELWEQPWGEYEYLEGRLQRLETAGFKGLVMRPDAQITIRLSRVDPEQTVSLGWLGMGRFEVFLHSSKQGGAAEWGAEAVPYDHGRTKFYEGGTYEYIRRRSSTDLRIPITIGVDAGNRLMRMLHKCRGQAVAIETTDVPGYEWLSTVGIVSGSMSAPHAKQISGRIAVKGLMI
jgi:hypothetical protein